MFLFLSYLGAAGTAIWLVEQFLRLVPLAGRPESSSDRTSPDLRQIARFARGFAKTEPIIALLFLTTSLALIGKYFAAWVAPPGYFLETINLFCVIGFWLNYRVSDSNRP
jgi:hypothetical protein